MTYLVPPGLYAVGQPDEFAPVVVTANYKMSYDRVRQALAGRNVWLLVLETYGINVWCAAGKGTFGTGELVRRIEAVGLGSVVRGRELILPIFGAAGVKALEVARRTGFSVRFATLRAEDLSEYLDNGLQTTPAMRELTFSLSERLVLVPVEMVAAMRWALPAGGLLAVIGLLAGQSASLAIIPFLSITLAMLLGTAVVPLLLPWLPGRWFSIKGAWPGLALASCLAASPAVNGGNPATIISFFLTMPVITSFLSLTFTGSTPFTSRSGVKKEMRAALPAMAISLSLGLILWSVGLWLGRGQ